MKLLLFSGNAVAGSNETSDKFCIIGIQVEEWVFGLFFDMDW